MGVVGNICSFLVFVFSKLNKISTSIYLAALSISDTGFLLCVWIGWFDIIGISFFHQEGICHIVVFLTYVFGFTSVWYVNAFTADMYVAVFYSSLGSKVCRPNFARKGVVGLTSFAVIFYLFSFWTSKIVTAQNGKKKCVSAPQNYEQMMIFTVLDTLLTLIIPFSMIIFMITRLLIDISKFYRSNNEANDEHCHSESSNSLTTGDHTSGTTSSSTQQGMKAQSKLKRMIVVRLCKSFRSALMRFPWKTCVVKCHNCCHGFNRMASYKINSHKIRASDENDNEHIGGNVHSRLVDIHLSELHVSQIPSFESDFVLMSPPCMLKDIAASSTEQTRL
ncbi:unnamed protein product [Mytilus coruscus]|uniref:G-protein coupled receptors family 1 profile domain-containing protein n=1 Tax=Mytilus coruscus TaxID=42192 RepID=A0A6J8EUV7_MYTCO|nr:unnamed protein product [Mytilus coruscus]